MCPPENDIREKIAFDLVFPSTSVCDPVMNMTVYGKVYFVIVSFEFKRARAKNLSIFRKSQEE